MSDTPRTDAHIKGLRRDPEVSGCDRTLNLCRQLERELTAAQAEIARLKAGGCARDQRTTQFCGEALKLYEENAKLLNRIGRLEEASAWRPIETAPTDMTWVIGYDDKDGEVGTIIFDLNGDVDGEEAHYEWTDGMRTWHPTHWMPIPDPPKAKDTQ